MCIVTILHGEGDAAWSGAGCYSRAHGQHAAGRSQTAFPVRLDKGLPSKKSLRSLRTSGPFLWPVEAKLPLRWLSSSSAPNASNHVLLQFCTRDTMSSMYESIDSERYEFRILSIDGGDDKSPIRGTLAKTSLLDMPQYFALSYCWGDETNNTQAFLNGVPTSITQNLDNVLKCLRRNKVDKVWVDAVCIQQSDATEKSLQIRRMKQIYEQGAKTISWLGQREDDLAELAVRFLRLINEDSSSVVTKQNNKKGRRWILCNGPSNDISRSLHHQPLCMDVLRQTSATSHDEEVLNIIRSGLNSVTDSPGPRCYHCALKTCFLSLIDLFERPYWKRRWVIQEIAASPRVTLICGTSSIAIQDLDKGIDLSRQHAHWGPEHNRCVKYYSSMLLLRQQTMTGTLSLGEALVRTSHFRSKDIRDKIYSLIGITSDGSELVSMPNYYRSPASATTSLARALIQRHSSLDLIWGDERVRDPFSVLPSWVPDWLSNELPDELAELTKKQRQVMPQSFCRWCLGYENVNILKLQGVTVATITVLTTSTGHKAQDSDRFRSRKV